MDGRGAAGKRRGESNPAGRHRPGGHELPARPGLAAPGCGGPLPGVLPHSSPCAAHLPGADARQGLTPCTFRLLRSLMRWVLGLNLGASRSLTTWRNVRMISRLFAVASPVGRVWSLRLRLLLWLAPPFLSKGIALKRGLRPGIRAHI